jgi:hypothetical protein
MLLGKHCFIMWQDGKPKSCPNKRWLRRVGLYLQCGYNNGNLSAHTNFDLKNNVTVVTVKGGTATRMVQLK